MDWKEVILPLLLAVIAAAPGVFALLRGRNKEKADTAGVFTDAAKDLVSEYRAKMDEMEEEHRAKIEEIEQSCRAKIAATEAIYQVKIEDVQTQVREQSRIINMQEQKIAKQAIAIQKLEEEQEQFSTGVAALCEQIRGLGHLPVWEPKK